MRIDRPLLTIAIPTYGRAPFLRELLACLQPQLAAQPKVELLISDNASPDDTAEVVREFQRSGLELRYLQNEINIGPDANFLQCYEQAAGRYVWVFGDDDLLLDGGLATVVDLLEHESPDYAFVAPYLFLETIEEIRPRRRNVATKIIKDPIEMITLVNLHTDLILISSGIVDKERIAAIPHPPFTSLVGSNLVQLSWILTSLRNLRCGIFVELGALATRGANSRGGFQAAQVFGESYRRAVSEMLEPNSALARKLIGDHLRIWFPKNWLGFRENGEDARIQRRILKTAFHDSAWYWLCAWPLIYAPRRMAQLWAKALWGIARIRQEHLSVPGRVETSPPASD
jgi:abequosyltransferase